MKLIFDNKSEYFYPIIRRGAKEILLFNFKKDQMRKSDQKIIYTEKFIGSNGITTITETFQTALEYLCAGKKIFQCVNDKGEIKFIYWIKSVLIQRNSLSAAQNSIMNNIKPLSK